MQKRNIWVLLLFLLFTVLAAGCGEKKKRITDGSDVYVKREKADIQEEVEAEEEAQEAEKLYAVTAIDTERQILTLRNCENSVESPYEYTGGTYIWDKYGRNLTVSQLSLGDLVTVEAKKEKLSAVQLSKDAFSYDDLHNFTLEQDMKALTVGSSIYYFDDNILVYYEGSLIPLSEISEQDTVCIKGIGQQIYTLQVTNGHGIVALDNVELFLGGYITIGNLLSQKVTPQMRIEVAEGTYLLSVANEGYGGSREITVEANQEVRVDLNELKGDGPKLCQMRFELKPENAEVYLDGEQVDAGQTIQVRYGTHSLKAKAEGYVDWTRTLIVNSAMATVKIEMSTVEETEEEETISTSNPSGSSGTDNNSTNNNNNTNNNSNNSNTNNSTNNNNTNNNTNNNSSTTNNSNLNNNNSNNSNSSTNNNSNNTNPNDDINNFLEYIKQWVDETTKKQNSSTKQ